MALFHDEEPTSGFVRPDEILKSERFTDIQNRGYCLLVRAKRNGRWWMLKGLKEQYQQDTVYQVHHSAALLYHKHTHKSRHNSYSPQIVPARQVYAAGSAPLRFSDSPRVVSVLLVTASHAYVIIIGGSTAQSRELPSIDAPISSLPLFSAMTVSCREVTNKTPNLQGRRKKGQKRTCK